MRGSEAMRDPEQDGEIGRFVVGIDTEIAAPVDYIQRTPSKRAASRKQKFSNCRTRVAFPDETEQAVRVSAVCGGWLDAHVHDVTLKGLGDAVASLPTCRGQEAFALGEIVDEYGRYSRTTTG